MRFSSGPGLHKFKITVRPQSQMVLPSAGGMPTTVAVKPLRAVFKYEGGHTFDSQKAQVEFGWTDEEREQVEAFILDPIRNPYLNKRDTRRSITCLDTLPEPVAEQEAVAVEVKTCKSVSLDPASGDYVPCTNAAIEGLDVCDDHLPIPR